MIVARVMIKVKSYSNYIKPEREASKEFKSRKLKAIIKDIEQEADEELNMVIEDLQFKGLGVRALELLKSAPMNR